MSIKGSARLGRRTKELVQRLSPGDIAIIAHQDLDAAAALGLAAIPVAAVVNTRPSMSGRYASRGAEELLSRGIPLFDCPGPDLFERIQDGHAIEIVGDEVVQGDEVIAVVLPVTQDALERVTLDSRRHLRPVIERFVLNTVDHVVKELGAFLDDPALPPLVTDFRGRQVVVVARGHGFRDDLRAIRPYLRQARPILVAVDGAADGLLEMGIRPRVILGDMDSVSDRALTCGAELVVHAYPDGRSPGLARVRRLGVDPVVFRAPGTSEDAALLLAHGGGAGLIVAVGTHSSPIDFLEKGRAGMASTFLVRMRLGPDLIDARGLSRLNPSGRLPPVYLAAVALAGLLPAAVVACLAPSARGIIHVFGAHLRSVIGF